MNTSSVLVREQKRRYWVGVGRAVSVAFWMFSCTCALSILAGLILAGIDGSMHYLLRVMVTSIVSGVGALLMPVLLKKVTTRVENYIDPRFASRAYPAVIRSLRKMNVTEPAVFIDDHPLHVEAYLDVKHAATNALDSHYSRMDSRVTAERIHDEAHRIAMLVFSGQDEIAREQRIIYFLETRGILDYRTLVEMLDETDSQPLPLLEGVL